MKDLRGFKPNQEQISAAKALFMAMAYRDTIEPIVVGYRNEILAKHQFRLARQWVDKYGMDDEVILDHKNVFLLEDEDAAVYFKECHEARDRHKLKVDNPEFCPLCVAESMVIDAQHLLIEVMQPVTGLDHDTVSFNLDHYRKYIDLCLRLLAPFVGTANEILGRKEGKHHGARRQLEARTA